MSDRIPFSSRVVVPDTVLFRELDKESVILNLTTDAYLGLDDVGTRMWMVLTSEASVEAAMDRLLGEYDVASGTLRSDVETFVERLLDLGLIQLRHE